MTVAVTSAGDDLASEALLRLGRRLAASGYRFTTVTPATHALVNARPGHEWARNLEDVFGWSRPFRAGLLLPDLQDLMSMAGVLEPHQDGWRSSVRFSSLGTRLFVHSSYPTCASDAVFFGPDTSRFAAALERWLARFEGTLARAVDVGCGAGPGAVVVAAHHPQAEVLAVDINEDALRLTRVNALLAGASNVVAARSDLLSDVDGPFDLIVSNPPYLLDADARTYRHGGGGHGEGLSLDIAQAACDRLAPGGTLLLYTGSAIVEGVDRFHQSLVSRLEGRAVRWHYEELDPDIFGEELLQPAYADVQRIAAVLLVLTRYDCSHSSNAAAGSGRLKK